MTSDEGYLLHIQLRDTVSSKLLGISRTGKQLTTSLTAGQRQVRNSFTQTTAAAGRLQASLSGLGTALSSLGLISGVAGAALAMRQLVSIGTSFEAQMSKVKALTGATAGELDMLTATARKLGQTTTFTAKQVAEAQGFAAMAGYTAEQINVATPAVLTLAKATGTDLAFAMDAATNIASQFGFEASELPRVVDRVAAVTASANTNFTELAEALKFIGPTAQALGVPIEETAAVLGKLASAGIKGSLAGRAFGTSLAGLTKATSRQQAILDDYGFDFFKEGNFVGIIGAIEQLERKLKNVTQKERNRVITTLFGAEAIQEVNVLLQEGSESLRNYEQQLLSSDGAAKRMAHTMTDNLLGSWKELTSAVQEASLTLFDQFGDGLRRLVQGLTKLVRALRPHLALIWRLTRAYVVFKVALFATRKALQLYGFALARVGVLMRIARIATINLSRAWRLLNVQLMRNPLTLVASVAAIGISFLVDWALTANDAAEAQKALNEEVAKMHAPVNKAAAAWSHINEALAKGVKPAALSLKGFSVKELEYASQQIRAFQENFVPRQLSGGRGLHTVLANAEITKNKQLLQSYTKLLAPIKKAATLQKAAVGLTQQDVGLSDPKAPENQAILESMKATVTGGRRNMVVNVNIGTASHVENLNNYTGEGDEELEDKVAEVVTRAVGEGASQGKAIIGES